MRFVIAIVLFIGAFLSIGYGIAQRTVLAGPDERIAMGDVTSAAPVTLIRGETLNAVDGQQRISISGEGPLVAAYGRTGDVLAWIGEAGYNDVVLDEATGELRAEEISGGETEIPSAVGSDLWLGEQESDGEVTLRINAPEGISVLVMSTAEPAPAAGEDAPAEGDAAAEDDAAADAAAEGDAAVAAVTPPAPGQVSLRWPVDNSAPWSGPLILGGTIALLGGLISFIWALLHARRRRGPRRKQPRLPRPPRPPRLTARNAKPPKAVEAGPSSSRRRLTAFTPVLLVPALLLAGCTSDGGVPPLFDEASPAPSGSAAPGDAAATQTVAVTQRQFAKILESTAATIAEADEARDAELAGSRLSGPALELRLANYKLRKNDRSEKALDPIPTGRVELLLPQQNDGWPRTVFAVVSDPENEKAAPQALMLEQASPRDPYTIEYALGLEPSIRLPDVASAATGASRLPTDLKLLAMAPDQLATAYGDILAKDAKSSYIDQFVAEGDTLRDQVGVKIKASRKKDVEKGGLARYAIKAAQGKAETIAFGTNDSGAIVATELNEVESVKPRQSGASISTEGRVKALSGKSSTTRGFLSTYGYQLLFYVPNVTAEDQRVVLLGYAEGLTSSKEAPR
ncbi:hypothetical protein [Homoserinibacter sp. YIM 151385]|uniref:hypothetical protein n=1 Tax=Homoserinibacter sp. YIM 151385 TaxID=2985506 RepID=UPI0022F0BEA0|nr:hypothetical protein [Homoserinibacter sp. YIM 151385]WBU39151.1 hypothetical protein OF852_06140 [Homoserinibacter sp. YIM 151385]